MKIIDNIERIERKWSLHNCTKAQFHIAICRSKFCFIKEYESRKVNSIYFDDINLNSLNENLDGNTLKAKYRVRWYGNPKKINSARFEIKMKKGFLSKKKIYNIQNNKFDFNLENLKKLTDEVNNILYHRKKLQPILTTHYVRDYFISANRKIRSTIDDKLQSIMILNSGSLNSIKNFKKLVLELKYSVENDEYVKKNLSQMKDLRLSKNSKYLISAIDEKFSYS